MKKRKVKKPTIEISGIKLYAEQRQYVVVSGSVRHYCAHLEEALDDMADLFERKTLANKDYKSVNDLLRDVEKVRQEFWKEYEEAKSGSK